MSGIVVTASTNPVYSASVQKGAGAVGGGAVGAGAIGGSGAAGGCACGGDTRMVMLVSSMSGAGKRGRRAVMYEASLLCRGVYVRGGRPLPGCAVRKMARLELSALPVVRAHRLEEFLPLGGTPAARDDTRLQPVDEDGRRHVDRAWVD